MSKTEQVGIVVRNNQVNTIIVSVRSQFKHRAYSKRISQTKTYMVHTLDNSITIGARVLIKETRPLSKKKHWLLKEIL
jgi:small subunit ribosomal protein S17|tara:strand:+ start:7909 stop:8142 length:234 start_codon:yes stop_codon:yes gene_type:complete